MRGKPRNTPNTSTLTNLSILEDRTDQEYSEFIKIFGSPDIEQTKNITLVGNDSVRSVIRELIDHLLKFHGPQFALITGPSGTGKTTVVLKLAQETEKQLTLFYLNSWWTLEKDFGNPRTRLKSLFDEAVKKAPSLIFIDKLDLICCEKRSQNDPRDRIINYLECLLDQLTTSDARVLVLAATDRPEMIDPRFRKPRNFEEEIKFSLPNRQDRMAILSSILKKYPSDISTEELEKIADASNYYSYENLMKVCKLASRANHGKLDYPSIKQSLSKYKPSLVKSVTTPCPPLHWNDIGGVDYAKKELKKKVIWSLQHRDKYQKLGIKSEKGALLYGPPGCSKTMLAQALATESGYNFISLKGPQLLSKYVGDSEFAVRKLYANAREIAPCIIFFDEIDGFAPERSDNQSSSVGEKVVTTLLAELNGIEPSENVFTIAATNRPDRVDSALLRPGRLEPIYIPLPTDEDRREIFRVHMRPLQLNFDQPLDDIIDKLVCVTQHYSGAEIASICQKAGVFAIEESLDNEFIEWRHFEAALRVVKPKTKVRQLQAFKKFQTMESGDQQNRKITKLSKNIKSLSIKK